MTWARRHYFPSDGRHTEGFLTLIRNPTTSVGFEPATLGIEAQHATNYATEAAHNLFQSTIKQTNKH